MIRADIAIVGAGMAGASLAAELAPHASVLLLETEAQPGHHATGRSAAFWSETYGGPPVQPLTSASGDFLRAPPAEFSERGFLRPRGALHIADAEGAAALDGLAAEFSGGEVVLEPCDRAALEAILPGLSPRFERGLAEPSCADIDVAALHAAYLRRAGRSGARLLCDARVITLAREGGRWRIGTTAEAVVADVVVDAAGAWASGLARLAGASPIDVRPYRRTLVQLRTDPPPAAGLPLIIDALGRFYFKPEAGRLWASPHDEIPVEAGDAAPEEYDVALTIDRVERAVDWRVLAREHAWAGLRSFAPDRAPVYGFDACAPGFFWCAGQGGFGIQTAPAGAWLAAALLLGASLPKALGDLDPERYAPERFDLG